MREPVVSTALVFEAGTCDSAAEAEKTPKLVRHNVINPRETGESGPGLEATKRDMGTTGRNCDDAWRRDTVGRQKNAFSALNRKAKLVEYGECPPHCFSTNRRTDIA